MVAAMLFFSMPAFLKIITYNVTILYHVVNKAVDKKFLRQALCPYPYFSGRVLLRRLFFRETGTRSHRIYLLSRCRWRPVRFLPVSF